MLLLTQYRKNGLLKCELREGTTLFVRTGTNDFRAILDVWSNRIYNPPGFEINKRDIVVDIGAHIGIFSALASRSAILGRVYAFEPVLDNLEIQTMNISQNKLKNVVVSDWAVSGSKEDREMILSKDALAHSFYANLAGNSSDKVVTVRTISLQDVLEENHIDHMDFLKLNCEGSEYDILFSAPDSVLNRIQKMAIQYHDIDDRLNVKALRIFLESHGFAVKISPPPKGYRILYASKETTT